MSEQELISKNELDDWRSRIEAAWQKSVESVIEVGRLVQQAKTELGASYSLLEVELPFSSTVAAFLVKIVENPILSDPQYFNRLPNSYNTLYHLSSIDNDELVKQIEDGVITPDYHLSSAKKLKSQPQPKCSRISNTPSPTNLVSPKLPFIALRNRPTRRCLVTGSFNPSSQLENSSVRLILYMVNCNRSITNWQLIRCVL